jgi:hypothetical protein
MTTVGDVPYQLLRLDLSREVWRLSRLFGGRETEEVFTPNIAF